MTTMRCAMPEANVLYAVTAVVVAGLAVWVAAALKSAKEPWAKPVAVTAAGSERSERSESAEVVPAKDDDEKSDDEAKTASKDEKDEKSSKDEKDEKSSKDEKDEKASADQEKEEEKDPSPSAKAPTSSLPKVTAGGTSAAADATAEATRVVVEDKKKSDDDDDDAKEEKKDEKETAGKA